MPAAVVAWPEEGQDLRLLGSDGRWRLVPGTATAVTGTFHDVVDPVLSSDGRQVAMSTNDGILVVDVTSGGQRTVPWPGTLAEPWDTAPGLLWLPGGQGFAVPDGRETLLITLDGDSRRAPYGNIGGLAFDPGGPVVEWRWNHNDIRVWQRDQLVSTAHFGYWGERLVTRYGRVALTGGGVGLPGNGGPMVVDAATGGLLGYAPIRDPHSTYTDNGFLTAKGFLDEDTLLLLVGPINFPTMDIGEETWHMVAWDIRTGAFEQITSGDTRMRSIDVAGDVLAAEWRK